MSIAYAPAIYIPRHARPPAVARLAFKFRWPRLTDFFWLQRSHPVWR